MGLRPAWTDADNERIREFVKQGQSILRAAAALRRTTKSVRAQARKIGSPFPSVQQARKKFAKEPNSSPR
jgi:hypothetical protein